MGGVEGLPDIRENTIRSFSLAGTHGADFVEFDVQVSKDNHAVIFHDDYIHTSEEESRRVGDLTIDEFRRIGPQEGAGFSGRRLLRQAGDGVLEPWECAMEGPLCTLEEAFRNVAETVGFNIEVRWKMKVELLQPINICTRKDPSCKVFSHSGRVVSDCSAGFVLELMQVSLIQPTSCQKAVTLLPRRCHHL